MIETNPDVKENVVPVNFNDELTLTLLKFSFLVTVKFVTVIKSVEVKSLILVNTPSYSLVYK